MQIAMTGTSGLIGRGLTRLLAGAGHRVLPVVRRVPGTDEIGWDPARGALDGGALEGLEAVVHLAGENIAGRFTDAHKRAVRESRMVGTQLVAQTLAQLKRPPKVLLCASAIGYYGDRGDAPLDESSPPGSGFLSEVCVAWEAAAAPAQEAGIRVCHVRVGVVLTPQGGALQKLLLPFRLGLGGRIGSGRQWMSWIDYDDILRVFEHCLRTEDLSGPINATAPAPVTNGEFAKALGRALGRPAVIPLPALAVRAAFGEMGETLLLAGCRALPRALERSGYRFLYPELDAALRHQLGR